MGSNIEIYNFKNNDIRIARVNDEPWFVAKDVCDVLELTNPTIAISELDEDERAKYYLGRQGETNIINEPGLYSLIFRSRKPEAKTFKRWVTHEVLPAVRKTGGYGSTDPTLKRAQMMMDGITAFRDVMPRTEKRRIMREYYELIGSPMPEAEALEQGELMKDPIENFIDERLVSRPGARLSREKFYVELCKWFKEQGGCAPTRCKAVRTVNRLGRFRTGRSNKVRYWEGVNLI